VIQEGEYGAGPVIVWDEGSFRNLSEEDGREVSFARGLKRGHVKFWLEGKKLEGGWSLRRTTIGRDRREKWLLVKLKDETADARRNPVSTQPRSVRSGRTIREVRRGAR
jgi:ATP-dependent DNA ligase